MANGNELSDFLRKDSDEAEGNARVFVASAILEARHDMRRLTVNEARNMGLNVEEIQKPPVSKFKSEKVYAYGKPEGEVKESLSADKDGQLKEQGMKDAPDFVAPKKEKDSKEKPAVTADTKTWKCNLNDQDSIIKFAKSIGYKINEYSVRLAKCDEIIKMVQNYLNRK